MTNATKGKLIKAGATALCVVAPLAATMTQFPMWVATSDTATMSGMFVVGASISCIPFWRQIREWVKSPSAWSVWLIITVVLIALRSIIDQMILVGGVGLAANLGGAGLYKVGDMFIDKPDLQIEEDIINGEDS